MSARKKGITLATLVFLGGMAAALLLPQALVAQGGLVLAEGLAPTKLLRIDLVSPGVNEGRFLLDMVHADIVHAITICPGDDRVLGIGADIPAISIVDLGDPVPTDVLVGFLPDEFIFSVFQLACSLDGEFFFTNLLFCFLFFLLHFLIIFPANLQHKSTIHPIKMFRKQYSRNVRLV